MNKAYKQADSLIREVIKDLSKMLEQNGEDISFYHHIALDKNINTLMKAKFAMLLGQKGIQHE